MRLNRKTREEAGRMIRASEEKYGSLFQNIPLPVWVYDSKTLRFLEVNQKAIEHYGYSKAEFLSMKIMDIRPADEQERLEKILNYYREPGRMYKRGVWTHRKKNGEQIFVDVISHDTLYTNTRATLILANDITAQMDLQQQVISEKIARQRAIAKATIEVQERERNEIGRELHDNVNQVLTSARLHLDHMEQEGTDQHKHRTISMNLINTAINEIRRLSSSLVPAALNDMGLLASIDELLQQVNGLGLLKIRFVHTGINEEALDPGLALSLYRIVQEQTTNILKYAEATEATITLEQKGGDLCLELQDNGKGFDPTRPRKGVGLANIINRADVYQGTVDITAAPGKGCRLKVCFQLPPLEDGIL
jgi:PAS domain S-box-containing protein